MWNRATKDDWYRNFIPYTPVETYTHSRGARKFEDSKNCAHLRCDWLLLPVLEYPESDTLVFSTDTSSILCNPLKFFLGEKKLNTPQNHLLPLSLSLSLCTRTHVEIATHLSLRPREFDRWIFRERSMERRKTGSADVSCSARRRASSTLAGFHARTDSPARLSQPRLDAISRLHILGHVNAGPPAPTSRHGNLYCPSFYSRSPRSMIANRRRDRRDQ